MDFFLLTCSTTRIKCRKQCTGIKRNNCFAKLYTKLYTFQSVLFKHHLTWDKIIRHEKKNKKNIFWKIHFNLLLYGKQHIIFWEPRIYNVIIKTDSMCIIILRRVTLYFVPPPPHPRKNLSTKWRIVF